MGDTTVKGTTSTFVNQAQQAGTELTPSLSAAAQAALALLNKGGTTRQVLSAAFDAFIGSDATKKVGGQAAKAAWQKVSTSPELAESFNAFVQHPQVAQHWTKAVGWAANPENLAQISSKTGTAFTRLAEFLTAHGQSELAAAFTPEAATALGGFAEKVFGTLTGKGMQEAVTVAGKEAPLIAETAGKVAPALAKSMPTILKFGGELLPVIGIVVGVVDVFKTFTAKPPSTDGQKTASVVGLAAGVVSVIPGVGTGAGVAINAGAAAIRVGADIQAEQGKDGVDPAQASNAALVGNVDHPAEEPQVTDPELAKAAKGLQMTKVSG